MTNYIQATNNPNYGGDLVNQKYAPVDNIVIEGSQEGFYEKIVNDRIQTLSQEGVFPKKLNLYAVWNPAPPIQPSNKNPPMIVISSKRAWWLKSLFQQMEKRKRVKSYNNKKTFDHGPVPWYAQLRSGRHCYIVVNNLEYDFYVRTLVNDKNIPFKDVTVVGYKYGDANEEIEGSTTLGGFGASRYAAIAMAIDLGYSKAWLVDDNVVHINGFPNTLQKVEEKLDATVWAIGFGAATKNLTEGDFHIKKLFEANFDFEKAESGLLQQVVLWNLALLRDNQLNFSPYFATSNEDVSLSNYLQKLGKIQKVVTSCTVIKLIPDNNVDKMDDAIKDKQKTSSIRVWKSFTKIAELFNNKEKDIIIKSKDGVAGLSQFTLEHIIPNSKLNNNDPDTKLLTDSIAIEQALSKAIEKFPKNWTSIKIFNPYEGFVGARIERIMAVLLLHEDKAVVPS